jgi:5'-deoxynucleotidase YfbR-like HD superfamily hydrolase
MNRILRKIAKEHNLSVEEMIEQVSPETKVIKVPYMFTELVNGSIMLYNKETKQFVSQADNLDKLAQNLMEHNKVKMAVVNHNNQMLWFVDGKVQRDIKET